MGRFAKKKVLEGKESIELNIMPFIDVFSLLCTFLLFSAVFVSVGIHVVQIPYLTNASLPQTEKKRSLKITIEANQKTLGIRSAYSEKPVDAQTHSFPHSSEGVQEMHEVLLALRQSTSDPEAKVDLYLDESLNYEQVIKLLDAIKIRDTNDPPLPKHIESGLSSEDLFPKVVFANVIL